MSEADAVVVKAAVKEFITAFDHLDWERFRRCFSPEATVFFPFATKPYRAMGQEEVEAEFKRFFAEVRARASGPPYLHIKPQDVMIHVFDEVALVTFHLDRSDRVNRRTLLLQRQGDQWRIAHLHASNMMKHRP